MKYLLLLFIGVPFLSFSQWYLKNSYESAGGISPDSLATRLLTTPGDIILNSSFSGNVNSVGYFNTENTTFAIEKGLYMTTGYIFDDGNGPFGWNASVDNVSSDNLIPNNVYLDTTFGVFENNFNASIIEYTFVPSTDSIIFNLIFASEEYPEYVGSSFNDAFSISLSGLGYSENTLISKLPNGDVISVENIHPSGVNEGGQYYPSVNLEYYDTVPDVFNFSFDGYTRKIRLSNPVQPGQEYHVMIVLADVGDKMYDSALFISMCETCSSGLLDVNETITGKKLVLYPNPSENKVSFNYPDEKGVLYVVNAFGQEVEREELVKGNNTISVHELPKGTYFFKIVSDSSSTVEKVIVA